MYKVKRVFGWLSRIDGEPEFIPDRYTILLTTGSAAEAASVLPRGYYADTKAGRVIFDNMPEPTWDHEFIRYEVLYSADGEAERLMDAYKRK